MSHNQVSCGFAGNPTITGSTITFGSSSSNSSNSVGSGFAGSAKIVGGKIEIAPGKEIKMSGVTMTGGTVTGNVVQENCTFTDTQFK
jgi:hypothetical protein